MAWLILAAGGVGCLLGVWLVRVPFIALISFALVLACAGTAPYAHWGLWISIWVVVALLSALQAGYVVGLFASAAAWLRTSAPHNILTSSHSDHRMM